MRGRVWTLLLYAVWLTWNEAEGSTAIAPVYSLPPTTSLDYPADDYAQLLTTPIQMQAEANGGFSILGNFFFASSVVNPWDKLFQLRNFNLETADALHLQIQIYQSDTAANYRFQIWKDGSACSGDFAKPATDNAWIAVDLQYDTGTDKWELKLNDVLVAQATCQYGWLENFQLNRVIVASQNWAGLRLYDSLLTDAEVASELDKICVPADTCADVLTAGCDSAPACPLTCSETLVSEWKFNNDFADSQGIYPLTATGISFVDGRYGEAATLDNDSDMLRTTNDFAPLTSTSKQTYSFWVKRSEVDDKLHHVFAQSRVRSDGNEWGVYFKPTPSNTLVVYVFGDPGLESATQFSDTNTWNHFIVTVDEGVFSLYQNGILEGTKTMSIGSISGPLYYTPDSILGNIGRFFPRLALDNFRFYNAVLSVSVVAACEASLTCSENTYATSGAVLAFNPDASGEIFDRSIPTEVDMGPVQWNVLDNGGVTLVSKLKFSASPSNYERVFAATDSATAGNALFQIMRRAETEAMFFIINDGDTSCLSDDIPITNEQWVSMLFQYDAATANIVVQLDGGTKHYKDCAAVAGFSAQNRLQNVNIFGKHGGSSPHFDGAIAGFYGFNSLLTSAEASLVLDSIVVGGDDTSAPLECAPCPTDGTVVAGCELPCHEPALSFNPDASQSMFDRADASGYPLPDQQMNFNTNGGFTLVAKFKFTGSASGAEIILAVAGTGINLYFKRHSDLTMQMHVQYNDPDLGTKLCNLYNVPSVPQNVEITAIVVVDLSASTVSLDLSGVQHTASCDAGFTLPNILCHKNQVGNGFWATDGEYFNGVVHGLYWYDRVLSGATAADVLSRIKVDALDTVVDRCNIAAPPQNITFLVSAGNVSAAALAPYHAGILTAVSTALNTASSHLSIASVADTAHNAANLRLVAADVPGADVDTLSQKTDEVAAAVKDAVNAAAGGSAVVCAAKAATILSSGANLTVYC